LFEKILINLKENPPLIHCITNYVTVNDCANILLACGASPIMADDENEVEEITSICGGLYINIGTLNEQTVKSMFKSGKKANELCRPVILDPVGAGASSFRTSTAFKLLNEVKLSVIRGNISEIKTVSYGSGTTKGVDADISDIITEENLNEAVLYTKKLSEKTGAVIAVTGAIDIVADSKKAYVIRNGNPMMAKVTGTGCMLTALIAAFCTANKTELLEAAAAAVCVMGLCGELAFSKILKSNLGTASYRTYIIDEISKMNISALREGMKIEIR
jgi:hydroxyethylthiazole kinase